MDTTPDGRRVLSAGQDGAVKLWDPTNGECRRRFPRQRQAVLAAALSPDGRLLATGGEEPTVRLYQVASGRQLAALQGHERAVTSVAFSPDGSYLITGSRDHCVKLWAVSSGQCLRTMAGHGVDLLKAAFSFDARCAYSEDRDKVFKIWRLDWELGDRGWADWDESARPWLEAFLCRRAPFEILRLIGCDSGQVPEESSPPTGRPTWSEEDFQELMGALGRAGYGWLRSEGVRRKLEEMAGAACPDRFEKD